MERTTSQETLQARENQLRALLLRGLDGDAGVYRAFLDQLGGHLRGFLRRRLQQSGELEDVLQEVLLAVHNARQTYRAEQPLTVWVQAICRYKLADHYRARGAAARRDDALGTLVTALEQDVTTARAFEAKLCSCLGGVVDTLKPAHAELLRRVDLNGESVQDVARALGLTPNNASVTLHRARKDLKARLKAFCGNCADSACLDCDCAPPDAPPLPPPAG